MVIYGYLDNLGRPRIAEIRKKADMAESDAEKETRMYKAKNDQEAQNEENIRMTAVAESQKEKDIKEAQIKEETERARETSNTIIIRLRALLGQSRRLMMKIRRMGSQTRKVIRKSQSRKRNN
jgi:flotillin